MACAMNILSAQERTITGIVLDGSMGNDPLPGPQYPSWRDTTIK